MKPIRITLAALVLSVATAHAKGAAEARSPTAYQCQGAGITLDYSSTSLDGTPRMSVVYEGDRLDFKGDDIISETTVMGELEEVVLKLMPDAGRVTGSLVIPPISLVRKNALRFQTVAILTTTRVPTAATPYEGVLATSKYVKVKCVARYLVF
jgi:hypothetical protein